MQQLTARVHVETGFHGSNNGALVADDGAIVLVDAPQLPRDAIRWRAMVAALGTPRYLVNTDHHPDHTVGNRWLPGAVVAHRGTRARLADAPPAVDYLRGLFAVIGPDSVPLLDGYEPRLPDITFDDRLDLHLDGLHAVVRFAPGHTANTAMVHLPDEGVLFTGDDVCEASLPSFSDASVAGVFAALDLIDTLAADHIVTGHGAVAGREVLGRFREQVRELVGRVGEARAQGLSRGECGARIRYVDRIHRDVPGRPDYPADLVERLQVLSIERIFDDIERDPVLLQR